MVLTAVLMRSSQRRVSASWPYARPGGINYPVVTGSGPELLAMLVRPDGRLLIASQNADAYNGTPVLVLFQTLPDGALDTTFNSPVINGLVRCMALQPDGRVVIGGSFTTCNGVPCGRIARIMPDGSLDPSFDPGEGADDIVHALALQADGKVVLGGAFNTVDGVVHERLARLNADGVPDAAFQAGAGDVVRSWPSNPMGTSWWVVSSPPSTDLPATASHACCRMAPSIPAS